MGLLAKRSGDEDDGGGGFGLSLDTLVCPTCRRELPPWMDVCPDDGATPVSPGELPPTDGPPIPTHLLEGLDEEE
jgi:hypothetical protein